MDSLKIGKDEKKKNNNNYKQNITYNKIQSNTLTIK